MAAGVPNGPSGHPDKSLDGNSKTVNPRPASIGSDPGSALFAPSDWTTLTSSHHSHQPDGGNAARKSGFVPDPEAINRGYRDPQTSPPKSSNPGAGRQRFQGRTGNDGKPNRSTGK